MIHGELPPDTNLYILYAINLFDISIGYQTVSYRWSLLVADQKSYLTNIVTTVMSLLTNAVVQTAGVQERPAYGQTDGTSCRLSGNLWKEICDVNYFIDRRNRVYRFAHRR